MVQDYLVGPAQAIALACNVRFAPRWESNVNSEMGQEATFEINGDRLLRWRLFSADFGDLVNHYDKKLERAWQLLVE